MSANDRLRSRGTRRAQRILLDYATEILDARLGAGISQERLGRMLDMSGDKVGRVERARLPTLSILDAAELAAILGMDLTVRLYPTGTRIRDGAQAARLARLLAAVTPPLTYRVDVPLPQSDAMSRELRAWDAVIYGGNRRTAIEVESRVTDIQATRRRHAAKLRDDPVDSFVLVLADTRHNRRILAEFSDLFGDLPRLRTAMVMGQLQRGQHPPSGLMLL